MTILRCQMVLLDLFFLPLLCKQVDGYRAISIYNPNECYHKSTVLQLNTHQNSFTGGMLSWSLCLRGFVHYSRRQCYVFSKQITNGVTELYIIMYSFAYTKT